MMFPMSRTATTTIADPAGTAGIPQPPRPPSRPAPRPAITRRRRSGCPRPRRRGCTTRSACSGRSPPELAASTGLSQPTVARGDGADRRRPHRATRGLDHGHRRAAHAPVVAGEVAVAARRGAPGAADHACGDLRHGRPRAPRNRPGPAPRRCRRRRRSIRSSRASTACARASRARCTVAPPCPAMSPQTARSRRGHTGEADRPGQHALRRSRPPLAAPDVAAMAASSWPPTAEVRPSRRFRRGRGPPADVVVLYARELIGVAWTVVGRARPAHGDGSIGHLRPADSDTGARRCAGRQRHRGARAAREHGIGRTPSPSSSRPGNNAAARAILDERSACWAWRCRTSRTSSIRA